MTKQGIAQGAVDNRLMTIVDFLEARIAQDERWAGESSTGPWAAGSAEVESRDGRVADVDGYANLIHITRHDPARVLAECAAKRAIIAEAFDYGPNANWAADDRVLRHLAAVYKGHPDYQQEWAL